MEKLRMWEMGVLMARHLAGKASSGNGQRQRAPTNGGSTQEAAAGAASGGHEEMAKH
jgi:hypothetical protein